MNEFNMKEVGTNAQSIWEVLSRTVTGISIKELRKQLALTFEEVFLAIRWLARDNNIGLANKDGELLLIGVNAN